MTAATCEQIGPELLAFLDGELESDARRLIADHVATCLVCHREIERLTAVGRLVADLSRIEPSPDFAARFWDRVEAEPPGRLPRARSMRSMRWALPGLALAALLTLALSSILQTSVRPPNVPAGDTRVVTAPPAEKPKVAAAPAAKEPAQEAPQFANVDDLRPEDLPPELLEHPELFLRLPVVRRLDTLEHFDAVRQESGDEDGAG